MVCPHCGSERVKKFGKHRNGDQRFRCLDCKKTFTEDRPRLLGSMRVDFSKAVECLKLLMDGMSIRACERHVGIHRDTICDLILKIGERCRDFLNTRLQGVPVSDVQVDEVWSWVAMKERTKLIQNRDDDYEIGDCYAYVGLERNTKLIVGYSLGKRDADDTYDFAAKLKNCVSGRFQLSTDGWGAYATAMPLNFGRRIDYARIIKNYKNPSPQKGRYCPAQIVSVDKKLMCGDPDPKRISTSHVERSNLTLRMTVRRWTRLTNAFSKTWRHHSAAFSLYVAFYNFVRPHMTLKTTPAVASHLTDHRWTMEELLTVIAA